MRNARWIARVEGSVVRRIRAGSIAWRKRRGMRAATSVLLLALLGLLAPLSGSLVPRPALAPGDATAAGFTNADPDSTVLIVPADGRPPQEIPRIHVGDGSYVALARLARALGVSYGWNPFSYTGWIATDSLRTTFTLDSPILNHEADAIQINAPIGYDVHGVLIPLDYLAVLDERWHGNRAVAWHAGAATFYWGSEAPTFRQLRIVETGRQSALKIPMRGSPEGQVLLWSPVGRLEILLKGASASAESLVIRGRSRNRSLLVRDVMGAPAGSRIRLDIGRDALGASAAYDAREGTWDLTTTSSREEIARSGFRGLQHADLSGWEVGRTSGPVVIVPFVDVASDPAEADSALFDLADRIARTLADTLLINSEVVIPREPTSAAQEANAGHARCVVGLRLDRYATRVGMLQVWGASPRLRWEQVDLTQSLYAIPTRPLLWSETPALSEGESRRMATTLASHLGTLVGEDHVESGARPSRWLEGFTMPAVMIYPGQANDPRSIERLMDEAQRDALAHEIAFGISEAIAGPDGGMLGITGAVRRSERIPGGPAP